MDPSTRRLMIAFTMEGVKPFAAEVPHSLCGLPACDTSDIAARIVNFYSQARGDAVLAREHMSELRDTKCAPSRRAVIKAALAAGVAGPAILRVGAALAAYPERPVRIVVANTPGGPSDIIARFMAAALQEAMGGSFVVENKGGGGGNIGMGSVARADPDGYTILLSTSAFSINPGLYETPPYDPFKDFTAVCELAVSPHVFTVKPELPVKTMKEFVALAKADPDKFNVSVPPIGTAPQLQPAAATRSRRSSPARCSSPPACWRRRIRRSRPARSRDSRSPAAPAGTTCRRFRPCSRPDIRTSCSRPTPH
jgi:hypothetical protein